MYGSDYVWFGRVKGFPGVEQLAAVAERGAPVHVVGDTDVSAALAYSNHRSVAPHVDRIPAKILTMYGLGAPLFLARRSAPHSQLAAVSIGRGRIAIENSDYPRLDIPGVPPRE